MKHTHNLLTGFLPYYFHKTNIHQRINARSMYRARTKYPLNQWSDTMCSCIALSLGYFNPGMDEKIYNSQFQ